jgi:hypothetical protein
VSGPGRRCGTCRHFTGQPFPNKPGWRRAAGKCGWVMPPLPPLPDSITRGHSRHLNPQDPPRSSVWPEDGETCPAWEALQ